MAFFETVFSIYEVERAKPALLSSSKEAERFMSELNAVYYYKLSLGNMPSAVGQTPHSQRREGTGS